ncbi:MAG TPA: RHS repeat-associated core domain-containing protein [Acidobacteriota bacterium]|nr:RHS repeat-associated core domain-containing protein [Acidobacteriota bacterium]
MWIYDVNPSTGGLTLRSQTRFNYDRYDATANHAALVSRSNIVNLQTGFTTSYKTRGNATSAERWLNTASSWVTAWTQYDVAGNAVKSIDPRSHATDFDYTDNFGAPNGEARTTTNPAELGSTLKAFAFVKKVTNPLSQASYAQYDYWTGQAVDEEDLNGRVRRTSYDLMGRPRQRILPDGGQTDIYYSDIDSATLHGGSNVFKPQTVTPFRRKVFTKVDTGLDRIDLTIFDGLGRVSLAGTSNDAYLDWTRTEYHGIFGVRRTSNPLSLTPLATNEIPTATFNQWTTYTYDALGRITVVTTPDGQTAMTTYQGNQTTASDQIGSGRRAISDALGRLATAIEPDPANGSYTTGYTTTYEYNALDQLTKVTQDPQQRTFTYDTLGRLTGATMPEWGASTAASGTTSYAYDASSNLTQKTDPRGVSTFWNSYDGLNRPASKSYNDSPATPTVTYTYDSLSASNGKGRLTSMSDGAGSESYSYDMMGRVTSMTRTTTGAPQSLTGNYTYNSAGGVKTAAYPGVSNGAGGVPLTIAYGYDNAGRQVSAEYSNGSSGQVMVSDYAFVFSASGATETTTLGNGTTETILYNNRMQPWDRSVPGILDLTYTFNRPVDAKNNGNILKVVDAMVTGWDFDYGYDRLNRLSTATRGSNLLNFAYDRWGNRLSQCSNSTAAPSVKFTLNANNKNRIASGVNGTSATTCNLTPSQAFTYDNAGNLLTEPSDAWTGRGAMTYAYDAESRIKSTSGGATATFGYDGQGRRVKKTVGGSTRYYFYDVLGNPVWESYSGIWETYNLYFNGKMVFTQTAAMSPPKVWLYTDHLGTVRVKANESGSVISGTRLHYSPFGERLNSKTDPVKYEFTGKERDAETSLDYMGARYLSSGQGRFTATDPITVAASRVADPQQMNLYAYARNNPLTHLDPTGMIIDNSGLSEDELKKWRRIREVIERRDENGNLVHPKLKETFDRLEADPRRFFIVNADLGKRSAGRFLITKFDGPDDFSEAKIFLNFKVIKKMRSPTQGDFDPSFKKYEGLFGKNGFILRASEAFGHEGSHAIFALDNLQQEIRTQQLLNQRDAALQALPRGKGRYPLPPDVLHLMQAAEQALIPSERFAQQMTKIIHDELRAGQGKK